MKIGCSFSFQNTEADWLRYDRQDFAAPPAVPDAEIFAQNKYLAELVEPLGFDSLFSVEHHFSPHHMTPNGVQLLTYFAGRTERIEFGTGLIVLPWHHPVRAAEEVLLLDNLLQGRGLTIGLGRGAAPREFAGLGIPLGESRARFDEGVEIFRKTLTERRFDFKGQFHNLSGVIPRPQAFSANLGDRLYAGCTTESSIKASANLGLRPMFVGAVGWEQMAAQMKMFNDIRAARGLPRSNSVVTQYTYCAPTEAEAWEGARRWVAGGLRTAMRHYEHDRVDVWQGVKGYEEYVPRAKLTASVAPGVAAEGFAKGSLWGTPERIVEQIENLVQKTSVEHLVLVMNPGDTPVAEAERSMRLIASEVLPAVRHLSPANLNQVDLATSTAAE